MGIESVVERKLVSVEMVPTPLIDTICLGVTILLVVFLRQK